MLMFERNADNYSLRDQLALHKATVAVCGLGGGGGYVAEILARTGVGKFILIDGDCFEDSNRNRQIGALGSTLGRFKVEVMAERLRDVSPWVSVSAHPAFIGPETADLLSGADVVCDCVDGDNKRVLNALCRDRGVPYCTGGLSGERFQVTMFSEPERSVGMYKISGMASAQANPAALLACSGFQAQAIINFLLGRDRGTLNRVMRCNAITCSISVEEVPHA